MVPYHTIAFSQQKLRAALRRAAGQDPAFTYGFVVHSRRYSDHPTLGLITLNGESLPLNERLLGRSTARRSGSSAMPVSRCGRDTRSRPPRAARPIRWIAPWPRS